MTLRKLGLALVLTSLAIGCSAGEEVYDDEFDAFGGSDESALAEDSELDQTQAPLFGIGEQNYVGCSDTRIYDIGGAQRVVGNNWSSYESFVERETGLNIGNCLRKRFQDNGKAHCDWSSVHGCSSSLYGHAKYSSHTAHICSGFLTETTTAEKPRGVDRRASYAALLAHEWAHTCWRNETNADNIDVATFNWYKSRYSVQDSTCVSCGG